jgi:hypothetical protein
MAPAAHLPSHTSPLSTTPLPHWAEQSESLALLQPVGQQPSPPVQAVIALFTHAAAQPLPTTESAVHATLSLHDVGQEPAPAAIAVSHFSPLSSTPLPHTALQSASFVALQPPGQQPSPATHAVTVA